jgi:DNA-binding GntR family transcriptional regulator
MAVADAQLTPLARSVLSAQVKDRLLRWIIEGELPPGARVIETRVARQLGTSQAPVREALRDLATLGLVEMHPFKGARVRQPDAAELIEAMDVRGELEAICARQAAGRVSAETLTAMRELIQQMRRCADDGDAHSQALANSAFHTLVVAASGNVTVQRLWEILEPFARTYLTAAAQGADLHWLAERHVAIVDALESGDGERAAQQMRIHAHEAEDQIGVSLDPRSAEPSVA